MKGVCELGMVGLGVMGRNLLLNMADHRHILAGYDKDADKVTLLHHASPDIHAFNDIAAFVDSLKKPRVAMMLVPAGSPVDSVINDLLPHFSPGDIIIDGGNSFFKDTDLRQALLAEQGIHFLGLGISGGEEGARHGPSIMPGGLKEAYEHVRPIFESVAARVNDQPCVSYLGPGSAGHFVKMVHNGVEYGVMLLLSDAYDFMKRGLAMDDDQIGETFEQWNSTELRSFLIEITPQIMRKVDETTGRRLIDVVLDVARQKGTGMWASKTAMDLHVPIPNIDMAVAMRHLSALEPERIEASVLLESTTSKFEGDLRKLPEQLQRALYVGMVITFAQGMSLLQIGSRAYGYDLNLETIARIWRGGCIIRTDLLDTIAAAFQADPELRNLLLEPGIAASLLAKDSDLREIVSAAANLGIPVPGLMSALAYYDSYRSAWLPANLIEAQRDYFGAHGYERTDQKGTFHSVWEP